MLKSIANGLSELPMVKSVALSGSKTSAINDNFSDLDIYVYSDNHVPFEDRARIFSGFESVRINCSPFEEGDEIIDKCGNVYDIMYRSTEWTEWQLDDVWKRHNARLGYTTCFIYNISTSEIIAENDSWFRSLQNETMSDYPEELCMNIIKKNMDILSGDGSSTFLKQAELAYKRSDIVSQNHRLSAILASYFDVLFAYNRALHPGEKKLQGYAHLLCHALPDSFDSNLETAIRSVGPEEYIPAIRSLIRNLSALLERQA